MSRRSALSLALGVLAIGAVPAQASFPGANGTIVYDHTSWTPDASIGGTAGPLVGEEGVWRYFPTDPVAHPRSAAWSPDGRRLAFDGPALPPATGRALFVMNADGSGLRQVGRGDLRRHNPNWSPDGTKLVFVQDNGSGAGSGDIYTITTGGGSLKRLTTAAAWDGNPDWGPDGTRIAYTCHSGGRNQVCQVPAGGGARSVTTGALALPGSVKTLSWAPSGGSIAFSTSAPDGFARIHRMTSGGGSLRTLVQPDLEAARGPLGRLAWSPDGTRIAYEFSFPAGEGQLHTVRASDGGDPRALQGNDGAFPVDSGGWQPVR
jgi:Tol biopolymer transport system component